MIRLFLLAISLAFASSASAQADNDKPIDASVRAEVIESLGNAMRATYVFPETAEQVAEALKARNDAGAYDGLDTASEFATKLREDLRETGNDRHLQLRYAPDFRLREYADGPPSAEEMAEDAAQAARYSFGIPRVYRLPGNIGYLDIRGFWRPEHVSEAYESAIQLVSGSDALIIDLRANGGGDPASVAQLMSHFFAAGDERHINSIYNRPDDRTREFWTNPSVETRYSAPVYVLTSSYTFSGGEEFAYDMQTQKRATLIGETTGGGANPGGPVQLAHGFVSFIPSGRAINPITNTNWEHVGVKPEIATTSDEAMSAAYRMAIEARLAAAEDANAKQMLEALLERLSKGELDLPEWEDPRERRR